MNPQIVNHCVVTRTRDCRIGTTTNTTQIDLNERTKNAYIAAHLRQKQVLSTAAHLATHEKRAASRVDIKMTPECGEQN